MPKRLKYLISLYRVASLIPNWYQVVFLILKLKNRVVIRLSDGTKFLISHYLDILTIKEIFLERQYEIHGKSIRTIIDIGGNIGTFSIAASRQYPKAKIVTYEPASSTYKLLVDNVGLNKIFNIKVKKEAVGKKQGESKFYVHPASGLSSLYPGRKEMKSERVPVTTLKEIIKANKIDRIDILKMDCEGSEYDIILNCQPQVLSKIRSMFVEYHDSLTDHHHSELVSFLLKNNYSVQIQPHPIETDIGIITAHL